MIPVCEGPSGEDLYQCEDAAKTGVCLNECYTLYVVFWVKIQLSKCVANYFDLG